MMRIVLLFLLCMSFGCSARNYTHYLITPAPKKPTVLDEKGTLVRPMAFGSTTMMKVSWNDGETLTEVQIPMLASGQRIVIEHSDTPEGVKPIPATRLIPPPPTLADKTLIEAYRQRGLSINQDAPEVSISASRTAMEDAIRSGNYQLALEWCALVLSRYASHPGFLRAKASILLMMGEKDKAIEIYEAVEEIESDPQVRKKLEELQKESK